ncbi:unnamed protein product, partial [Owenia fusiformis]
IRCALECVLMKGTCTSYNMRQDKLCELNGLGEGEPVTSTDRYYYRPVGYCGAAVATTSGDAAVALTTSGDATVATTTSGDAAVALTTSGDATVATTTSGDAT